MRGPGESYSDVIVRVTRGDGSGRRELARAKAGDPAESGKARKCHHPGRWFGSRDKVDRHVTAHWKEIVIPIAASNPEGISRRADHTRIATAANEVGATVAAGAPPPPPPPL
jgi:hypothetical protein